MQLTPKGYCFSRLRRAICPRGFPQRVGLSGSPPRFAKIDGGPDSDPAEVSQMLGDNQGGGRERCDDNGHQATLPQLSSPLTEYPRASTEASPGPIPLKPQMRKCASAAPRRAPMASGRTPSSAGRGRTAENGGDGGPDGRSPSALD